MTPPSLRWRLLAGSGVAILVALIVAWLLMSLVFSRHLERRIVLEMTGDANRVVALIDLDAGGTLGLTEGPSDPRFEAAAGGHYWEVSEAGRSVLRSRSLWDAALSPPDDAVADEWRLRRSAGPFDEPVFILYRAITLRDDRSPRVFDVQVARDQSETTNAQTEFDVEMALFLAALWVFLMIAAWIQVHLGLSPLREIGRELGRLRANPAYRMKMSRMTELAPLIQEINDLADARAADLKHARGRASDLAHGLKTPLAALSALSARLRGSAAPEAVDGVNRAIQAIHVAVESELSRSRFAVLAPGSTAVLGPVEQLVSVLEHTEPGGSIAFSVEIADGVSVPLVRDDLIELLGPLLDNAVRFARRRVVIAAGRTTAGVELSIDDDGPGIPPDRIPLATLRGARLDERGPGQGLGLSIAKTIAEASGGALRLEASQLGGLRAVILWPAI